jgi:flagellar biosynthesis chaperone FliJ
MTKIHKQAQITFEEYMSRTESAASILQIIDKSRNETVKQNREKLIKIISALHFCGKQMIAFRGHSENES